jgi:hypothetical protein
MIHIAALLLSSAVSFAPLAPYDPGTCRIAGEPDAVHAERALAACASARGRFALLFGEAAPSAIVMLRDEPGYRTAATSGVAVVAWPAAAPAQAWQHVLPHETMHALLLATHFPDGVVGVHDGYGTPLPDWFEEAVAIWAEPPAARTARLAHARRLEPALRDLPTILATPHPAAGDTTLLTARDGRVLRMDRALRDFYPQSFAVLSFVYDAGGADAVRELTRRLSADPSHTAPLAGLPGLPLQMTGVVRAWNAWISETVSP